MFWRSRGQTATDPRKTLHQIGRSSGSESGLVATIEEPAEGNRGKEPARDPRPNDRAMTPEISINSREMRAQETCNEQYEIRPRRTAVDINR